jgi:indole-3-pyruvate monooxygenase
MATIVEQTHTLIIGSSISGLATAASLQNEHIEYILIEKEARVAAPWHLHYDRLHLHTNKRYSNLPYKKFPKTIQRYPGRQEVVDYLESYQRAFNIRPRFGTEALQVKRENGFWITETTRGSFLSKYLVMATGAYSKPKPVYFNGMETFRGEVMHSYSYRNGKPYKDKKVLVVGFGNSACEIAIDLVEQGVILSMSVRSPVNVIPREILGVPVLTLSLLMKRLPPALADLVSAPLIKWTIGDIRKLGLKKLQYGPLEEIQRDRNAPVIDIGTIRHIRLGNIKIHDGIDRIDGSTVYFKNGKKDSFEVIIAGIGYYRDLDRLLDIDKSRFDDLNLCADKQQYFGRDGLYFCGFWISPTGQIREIALDAVKIARHIRKQEAAER